MLFVQPLRKSRPQKGRSISSDCYNKCNIIWTYYPVLLAIFIKLFYDFIPIVYGCTDICTTSVMLHALVVCNLYNFVYKIPFLCIEHIAQGFIFNRADPKGVFCHGVRRCPQYSQVLRRPFITWFFAPQLGQVTVIYIFSFTRLFGAVIII